MYENLVYATPGLTAAQVPNFFKDASFGVQAGQVERTYSPRAGLTIVRDSNLGVAHIYGVTRSDTLFGAGYAGAEDRLFFMDVLRHAGRAQLSGFAGGANKAMDADVWSIAPYTEADLQEQVDKADDLYGSRGRRSSSRTSPTTSRGSTSTSRRPAPTPTKMPYEYAAIGKPLEDWTGTDVIATASLIGGIFGKGGGNEVGKRGRARGGQGPLRRRRRRAGLAGLPPPGRPRGADDREERQRLVRLSEPSAAPRASRCRTQGSLVDPPNSGATPLGRSAALLGGLGLLERRCRTRCSCPARSPSRGARWP